MHRRPDVFGRRRAGQPGGCPEPLLHSGAGGGRTHFCHCGHGAQEQRHRQHRAGYLAAVALHGHFLHHHRPGRQLQADPAGRQVTGDLLVDVRIPGVGAERHRQF